MKKILFFIIVMILSVLMVGCGSGESSPSSAEFTVIEYKLENYDDEIKMYDSYEFGSDATITTIGYGNVEIATNFNVAGIAFKEVEIFLPAVDGLTWYWSAETTTLFAC